MSGKPFKMQKISIVRFLEYVWNSLAFLTNVINGLISGRKMKAPRMLRVRCTSHTPMAAGLPVTKAATITSKTVPMFAPKIYGRIY